MSYHDEYIWQQKKMRGIDAIFSKACEVKYPVTVKAFSEPGPLEEVVECAKELKTEGVGFLVDILEACQIETVHHTPTKRITYINITTMKAIGINPDPKLLRGVKLVKAEE